MKAITLELLRISKDMLDAVKLPLRGAHQPGAAKIDWTPFTDIELEMERLIDGFLQSASRISILTEESGVHGISAPWVWVLDPIDGTKVFLNGLPNWGISLGLLVEGKPALGFFYMPVGRDFYWGGEGFGAFINETDLTTVRRLPYDDPLAFLAVSSNATAASSLTIRACRRLAQRPRT